MGRMGTIATMLDEGESINDIANQLKEWEPYIGRTTALQMAMKYMTDWREARARREG